MKGTKCLTFQRFFPGKYKHEEAIATASMADDYLMVRYIDIYKYITK